jgi:hypothetical protein
VNSVRLFVLRRHAENLGLHAEIMVLRSAHILASMEGAFKSKQAGTRMGAFMLATALMEICRSAVEPYLVSLVCKCFEGCADKSADVHVHALGAGRAIVNNMCPYGTPFVLPQVRYSSGHR